MRPDWLDGTPNMPVGTPEWCSLATDKIEGLEADLRMAVQVAWRRGAKEWARLNYPGWVEWLESCDRVVATPAPSQAQDGYEAARAAECAQCDSLKTERDEALRRQDEMKREITGLRRSYFEERRRQRRSAP